MSVAASQDRQNELPLAGGVELGETVRVERDSEDMKLCQCQDASGQVWEEEGQPLYMESGQAQANDEFGKPTTWSFKPETKRLSQIRGERERRVRDKGSNLTPGPPSGFRRSSQQSSSGHGERTCQRAGLWSSTWN